jgi:hypothetical protein
MNKPKLDSTLLVFTNGFKESLLERDFQILRSKVIAKQQSKKRGKK